MKNIKLVLLFVLIFTFVSNSCKKGPDDPRVSLTTRKARMVGTWNMTRGNIGLTGYTANQPPFNQNFVLDGKEATLTQSLTYNVYTLKYSLMISFDKTGKMTLTENIDGATLKATGTWNFCSGIGKEKNKEALSIKLDAVTSGDTQEHLFNNFGTEITYHIKRLANEQLVLTTNSKAYMNNTGDKGVYDGNFTFSKNGKK